jgi:hypothetical protein
VGARQHLHLDPDIADLVEGTAVRTPLLLQQLLAEDVFPQDIEVLAGLAARVLVFLGDGLLQLLLQLPDLVVALRLGILPRVTRVHQAVADLFLQIVVVALVELRRGHRTLGLAHPRRQLADHRADLLDLGMRELDGVHHRIFLHFVGARFDHHDAFFGAAHHDVQQALADLRVRGVHHEVAAHQPDAHRRDRTQEGDVGDRQRAGGAVQGRHVRIVLGVGREHERDHLRLVAETFREQRPHRTIDQPGGDDLFFARPALPLDESAGDAPARVGVFAVIDRQGEEINALAGLRIGAGRCQHHVFGDAHHAGTVCLLRQLANFKGDLLAA